MAYKLTMKGLKAPRIPRRSVPRKKREGGPDAALNRDPGFKPVEAGNGRRPCSGDPLKEGKPGLELVSE
jgi:hypothetical protein